MSKFSTLEQLKLLAQRTQAELAERDERINGLVTAGGEPNKLEGVKVNGTALTIADKMVDILIATGTENGTIAVNGADVAVKGLAALAYKAEVSEAELSAALKAVIDAKAAQADVEALSGKVTTLIGEDAGKSARAIANEELAKQLVAEGAAESLDTLEEIAAWIQAHPGDAAAMNKAIDDLEALVGKLPAEATSTNVVDYIAEAITTIGIGDYAKTEEMTAAIEAALADYYKKTEVDGLLNGKVDKVEGKGLSTNDYTTEEKEKLAGVAEGATKVEKSNVNGNVKVNGTEVNVYTPAVATDDEVNAMLTEVFGE